MSDPNHSLAEISHLFLSAVREKATNGSPRPQRIPPGGVRRDVSVDITPEELARVLGEDDDAPSPMDRGPAPVPAITAVIGNHLSAKQFERVKEYARHLAGNGTRVGVIEVDASEFRVMCFDRFADADGRADGDHDAPAECFDPRQMSQVLEEMSWDVQRWLLVLPTTRVPEARALLRDVGHWLVLSTCDHDGVVSCYRTLKGLADVWPSERDARRPALSLALLDASDDDHADRVSEKLVGVCQQFLNWPLSAEPHVRPTRAVSEHLVMLCRPTRDKTQIAAAPQWQIVQEFIARSNRFAAMPHPAHAAPPAPPAPLAPDASSPPADADVSGHEIEAEAPPAPLAAAAAQPIQAEPKVVAMPNEHKPVRMVFTPAPDFTRTAAAAGADDDEDGADVIDLPESAGSSEGGIVDAILKHCSGELVECPVTPPMCPRARLAVSRDRRIVMLAVSREVSDLNTIGLAYKWLQENQQLIGMAVPQLAIDPRQPPHLSLLVNQSDTTAHTLQPMLEGAHVTVKTYRKLRWGGKTGLLLEAA